MHSLVIAIKSGCLEDFVTAHNFTVASINHKNIEIKLIFFYQEGVNILLSSAISQKWYKLINDHNLNAMVCSSAYKKRGITINGSSIKANSMLAFIDYCESSDRVIQF